MLRPFERKVYSQNGEDGVIEELFDRIGTGPRFAVEFGAGDGVQCCTQHLHEQGWQVLQMDSNPGSPAVKCEHIAADNISQVLAKYGVPHDLDLLCIDIDSNDFWVWKALDHSYQPRLVVIEYNASIPPTQARSVAYDPNLTWDGSTYFGASLLALHWLANSKGYDLVHCDSAGVNAFFVRADLTHPTLAALSPATAYREPSYRPYPAATRAMIEIGLDLNARAAPTMQAEGGRV